MLIGHPIGDRSLVAGLRRAPPTSILTYYPDRNQLEVQRYRHWPEPTEAWQSFDFIDALERDIRGCFCCCSKARASRWMH